MSDRIDTEALRNLLAKCPQWPADKTPDGDGYYDCPVCEGDGSVGQELVHGRSSNVWAGGFQFYGRGNEFLALEAVALQTIDALPALLDAYDLAETLRKERDAARADLSRLRMEVVGRGTYVSLDDAADRLEELTTRKPRFGEWMRGIHAGLNNPIRDGMYVETIARTGRMNPGRFYRLTDGKGRFWEYPVDAVAFLPTASEGGEG